ncbi:MAG: DUF6064 family protein [Hyphomicrobiaceae bacterium]|jgi:hypothetical protein|nr:DUF6064 family protein [Hyphomicrobiaceae bacterium]
MSQWWTYLPADLLMFSPETYYRLFELYNADVWPTQVMALGAGLGIATLMVRGLHRRGRAVATLLATVWLAVAWGYFFERYATINLAAPYFAWGFAAQAFLIAVSGVLLGRLTFDDAKALTGKAGIALFIFALLIQPSIGPLIGREWSGVELFGLAPDPTVLGTLGVLLAADRVRWELFIIPILWCAITGAILWVMKSPEALLMPLAGLSVLILATYRSLKLRRGLVGI